MLDEIVFKVNRISTGEPVFSVAVPVWLVVATIVLCIAGIIRIP